MRRRAPAISPQHLRLRSVTCYSIGFAVSCAGGICREPDYPHFPQVPPILLDFDRFAALSIGACTTDHDGSGRRSPCART